MVLLFICYALMATQPIMDHCRRDGRFLVRFFTLEGRFPFYLITRAVSMLHNVIFLNFKHFSVHYRPTRRCTGYLMLNCSLQKVLLVIY